MDPDRLVEALEVLVLGVENRLRSHSLDVVAIHEKRYRPVRFRRPDMVKYPS